MKVAVVTDQISRDLDTACEQVSSWGGRDVELRGVGEGTIGSNLSPGFLDGLCAALQQWDVRVSAISPLAFRIRLGDPAMRYHRRILLPASLHLAVMLGAPMVLIGAPQRPAGAGAGVPDEALEILAEAAELAGNLGLTLGLENEPGSFTETAAQLDQVVRTVGHHALKIAWDPAVGLMAGEEPFPNAYGTVSPNLVSVRLRDVARVGSSFTPVLPGDGACRVDALITALHSAGYKGVAALDPRLSPRLEGSRAAFETVERMRAVARRAPVR